jgi:hypothetical protein
MVQSDMVGAPSAAAPMLTTAEAFAAEPVRARLDSVVKPTFIENAPLAPVNTKLPGSAANAPVMVTRWPSDAAPCAPTAVDAL